MISVKSFEHLSGISLADWGVYPKTMRGIIGILTSPFIHGDWSHLGANSASLFVLTAALFYFYRKIAIQVFLLIWFMTGLWVWMGARDAYHIGASGLVYGVAAFLFVSGLIRRDPKLSALAMVVVFLYGSLIWGIFPSFFPEKNISWESHLGGFIAGGVLAVYFREKGPRKPKYSWEEEDDDETEGITDSDIIKEDETLPQQEGSQTEKLNPTNVQYHYVPKTGSRLPENKA